LTLPIPPVHADDTVQFAIDTIAQQFPISRANLAAVVHSEPNGIRIIRGTVAANGTKVNGAGFTPTRTAAGRYTITFTPAFAAAPSETLTSQQGFLATRSTAITFDTTQMGVLVTDPATATATDQNFSFHVIGPA
jgi:hypothetical protein